MPESKLEEASRDRSCHATVRSEEVFERKWRTLKEKEEPQDNGGVAQLGEHLPCKQGVMGSNPIISTSGESPRPNSRKFTEVRDITRWRRQRRMNKSEANKGERDEIHRNNLMGS